MNNTFHHLNPIAGIAMLLIGLTLVAALNLTFPRATSASPGVLYAAPTAQGSGNCTSWDNACTLQTALAQAVSGDEIWVKAGVHYPGAASDQTASFNLPPDVAVYGGFAGAESAREARDWVANVTVLSGDIDHNDITDARGVVTTTANIRGSNAYHVVKATGGGQGTAVLDGVIVTAGKAAGSREVTDRFGGGMLVSSAGPTVRNVTFSGNDAVICGGGMVNNSTFGPTLEHVTFVGNSAGCGGGLSNYGGDSITLTDVVFTENTASAEGGGGMYNQNSNPTLTSVTFSGNGAHGGGGGLYNDGGAPILTDVAFSGNTAHTDDGGGMYNSSGSPALTRVTFTGNTGASGGGMYTNGGAPTLNSVTFADNEASWEGGGMYNTAGNPTLTNAVFRSNRATGGGGGLYDVQGNPTLIQFAFVTNAAPSGAGMYSGPNSHPQLINGIFNRNTAGVVGGGLFVYQTTAVLTNTTFAGNSAGDRGAGLAVNESVAMAVNSILWGNTAPTAAEIFNGPSSTVNVSYSIVKGGYAGAGNKNADPLFIDAAAGNLRVRSTSPAVDAGNNAAVPATVTTDLDGHPRFADMPSVPDSGVGVAPIVDMGAYEVQPPTHFVHLPLVLRGQ